MQNHYLSAQEALFFATSPGAAHAIACSHILKAPRYLLGHT